MLLSLIVKLELIAGDHDFPSGYALRSCKSPVFTYFRFTSGTDAFSPPERLWEEDPIDITPFVSNYTDSWSADDFKTATHTANITVIGNPGMSADDDFNPFPGSRTATRDDIMDLPRKGFYVSVYAGYEDDCIASKWFDNVTKGGKTVNGLNRIFTGFCQ